MNYSIYIDESGDLGVAGKGSHWFVLAGLIVRACDEPFIRSRMDAVKTKLNVREIHLKTLRKHFDKCAFIVNELGKCPFTYICIVVDTTKISLDRHIAVSPIGLLTYNFACRFMLERASWFLRDAGGTAKIVLSSRGTSRDRELINYIKKLNSSEGNQIAKGVFTDVCGKTAPEWDMLQFADVCATTMFYAFEKNSYGFTTPCFAYRLAGHLYKHGGSVKRYGIKFYSEEMEPPQDYIRNMTICRMQ